MNVQSGEKLWIMLNICTIYFHICFRQICVSGVKSHRYQDIFYLLFFQTETYSDLFLAGESLSSRLTSGGGLSSPFHTYLLALGRPGLTGRTEGALSVLCWGNRTGGWLWQKSTLPPRWCSCGISNARLRGGAPRAGREVIFTGC